MAHVHVTGATKDGDRIAKLAVQLPGLPARVIDRDTALAWMKDGHSLVAYRGGVRGTALQLVEVGDEAELFIRADNAAKAKDSVGDLPAAR